MLNDLRYAVRQLRKSPGFTTAAVLTLALGIGANTAIFSVVYAVLLRPLPYREPERLVQLYETGLRAGGSRDWVSFPNFLDWRRQNQVFEDVAAYRYWPTTIAGEGTPETVLGLQVTSGLFSVLGVHPSLGRTFLPEEDQPGKGNVAILSYNLWQRRFGGSHSIAGRPITIDGQSCTIIGVMPDGFQFPFAVPGEVALDGIALWIPMRNPDVQNRSSRNYWAIARLKRGFTLNQAQLNMDGIGAAIAQQYPNDNRDLGVKVASLQQHLTREVKQPLWILLGAIGLVLLIACANLASLLLSKVNTRLREMAVRAALGASRFRLVMQSLTEACLLSLAGAALGLLLAVWAVESFRRLGPANIPRLQDAGLDLRVLLFALVLSLGTVLLFGLFPALLASRTSLNDALKDSSSRNTLDRSRGRLRDFLIVGEVAMALILLAGAGLLIQSFRRLLSVDSGFDPRDVVAGWILLPPERYPQPEQQAAFFQRLVERIQALPGVAAAAACNSVPLSGLNDQGGFRIEGRPDPPPGAEGLRANRPKVSSDYFQVMGIRLLRGRAFTENDRAGSLEVAIISDVAAQKYWPNEDPLGKRITLNRRDGKPVWREIVGIVKGVTHFGLETERYAEIYVPHLQVPSFVSALVVRTRRNPMAMAGLIKKEVASQDPTLALFNMHPMHELVSVAQSRRRFQAALLGAFAGLALTLAAVGIYGVVAYWMSQRVREIAIRMAVGARQIDVLWLTLRHGLVLTAAGLVLGLAGASAMGRFIGSLLFRTSAVDLRIYAVVCLILAGVALLACYFPARRAAKVDPMVALRCE
jgi:putative ABC transport system permease protein